MAASGTQQRPFTRVLLVSDSHLGPNVPSCLSNWRAVRDFAGRCGAHLTVHLGDITRDAVTAPGELFYAVSHLAHWPTPLIALPGNHDIGDNSPSGLSGGTGHGPAHNSSKVPTLPASDLLMLYRASFGPDRFLKRIGARWALIGLNPQLFGTDPEEEKAQWAFLEESAALMVREGRRVAVLSHKPLYETLPEDEAATKGAVPPPQRQRLLNWMSGMEAALFLSGHIHRARRRDHGNIHHVWAPSTANTFAADIDPETEGKFVGVALLGLFEDGRYQLDFAVPEGVLPYTRARGRGFDLPE